MALDHVTKEEKRGGKEAYHCNTTSHDIITLRGEDHQLILIGEQLNQVDLIAGLKSVAKAEEFLGNRMGEASRFFLVSNNT